MKRAVLADVLTRLGACDEAMEWVGDLGDEMTAGESWEICPRGDWMLWALSAMHRAGYLPRKPLVLAVCATSRCATSHLKGRPAEAASLAAIEMTERWCRGEATIAEVIAARESVYQARRDAWKEYRRARDAYWDAIRRKDRAAAAAAAADAAAAAAADAAADAACRSIASAEKGSSIQ